MRTSTAPWLRIDASLHQNPDLRACGKFSSVVFEGLLHVAKQQGRGGRVPAAALSGRFLADYLNLPDDLRHDIEAAGEALVAGGLLVPDEEGYAIVGWSNFQNDPTARERFDRWQAENGKKKPGGKRAARPTASNGSNVSNASNADGTGRDGTGLDVEEEAEAPPAPSPAEDPRQVPEAPTSGPRLGAGQRANLLPSCINMREGGWPKWEAPLARLLGDGVTADEINAHLSRTPKSLPAWKALRPFEDRLAASVPKAGSTNGKKYPTGTAVDWRSPA